MAKLPEGWIVADLGEFCEGIRGVTYKPDDLAQVNTEKTITLLRSNNIKAGALNFKDVQHVAQKNVNQKQVAQLGDIAVCMSNGSKRLVGKSAAFKYIPEGRRYTVGSFCSIFRPLESACPVFVEQVFCSDQFQKQVDFSLAGSAINNLKNSDLITYQFLKPPVPEQQKIATILSSVDNVIEKTYAQIDKLKDLKTGMMQELLTKGIGHTEFKDSPVGRIPEEWSLLVLDDMKTDKKPILRTGPFGSSLKSKDFQSTGIPVINIQNLGVGRLERENIYFISKEKATELQGYTVNYGDLVFSRVADVGRSVVIPEYANGWVMSSNLMRISVDTDRIDPKYLMYQLVNGPAVMLQLRQMIADGGRPVVTGPLIKQINFPIPPLKEQCSIVKKIDSVDDVLAINEEKSVLFSNLKKALMQDLLTGKVRVNLNESTVI